MPLRPSVRRRYQRMSGDDRAARAGDGRVERADVFDGAGDSVDVALRARTTPQGRGEPSILCPLMEMLSAPSAKSHGCGFVDEGEDHPAERGIGMDVGVGNREVVEDLADLPEVVHRALHRGADVCEDDRRHVAVNAQRFTQVSIVHLPVRLALHHDVPRVLEAQDFRHGVVRVLAEVTDALADKVRARRRGHTCFPPCRRW